MILKFTVFVIVTKNLLSALVNISFFGIELTVTQ